MTALRSAQSGTHPGHRPRRAGWTAPRIVSALAGVLLSLCSIGLLGTGGVAVVASTTQRHGGAIDLGTWSYRSTGYALASSTADMYGGTSGWPGPRTLLGTVQIRVTPDSGAPGAVFAGIAPAGAARRYLAGARYDTVRGLTHHHPIYLRHDGAGGPALPPGRAGIWAVGSAGAGPQTLRWPARDGRWTAVVMNADGSRPVAVRLSVAATMPDLSWIAVGLLAAGILVLAAGVALVAVPTHRAVRSGYRDAG